MQDFIQYAKKLRFLKEEITFILYEIHFGGSVKKALFKVAITANISQYRCENLQETKP